ncbi:Short-chain dehydrogenase/reductase SDR [Apiospora aurea]|uniref:Short-chain dehydrogenase/reductase SDR n=1 Tax=Apiospora aurea TaxID=335848 RepID=A0ABR1QYB4_9PEZI
MSMWQIIKEQWKTLPLPVSPELWRLELAPYDSVQAFAKRAADELGRLDALVANAVVYLDQWTTVTTGVGQTKREEETSVVINAALLTLLGLLLLPMLAGTAKRFPGSKPRLAFAISVLAFSACDDLASISDDLFDGLNGQEKANMRNW